MGFWTSVYGNNTIAPPPPVTSGVGNKTMSLTLVDGVNTISHNMNAYIVNLTMLSNPALGNKPDISLDWEWKMTGLSVDKNKILITASLDAPIDVLLNLQGVNTI